MDLIGIGENIPVDVAFITVNFNTCDLVRTMIIFFSSIKLPFTFRLVVVDNNSNDGSQQLLSSKAIPELIYLQTKENLGYGRGMNFGLTAVSSKYACIMNTDLILNRETLIALWNYLEKIPQVSVVCPLILGSDGRQQGFIFHPGILSLYSSFVCKFRSKVWKRTIEKATLPLRVPGVLGAFFMIRRSDFSTRLFDEDFFFYYEDTELAHRYWSAGLLCYVLPQFSLVHLGGQSTTITGRKLFQKSRQLYISKVYSKRHAFILRILDCLRLYSKLTKYHLLYVACPTEKIRSKLEFYTRLLQND